MSASLLALLLWACQAEPAAGAEAAPPPAPEAAAPLPAPEAPASAEDAPDGGAPVRGEPVPAVPAPLEPAPTPPSPNEPAELPALEVPAALPEVPREEASPHARVTGFARMLGAVDTRFDSPATESLPENVAELRTRAGFDVDVELSSALHLRVAPRAFHRAVTQRGLSRTKATWELLPSEAYLDVYGEKVDVRLGYQVVAFGANALLSPADVLNPRDLRQWLLFSEPDEVKLPNLAARAVADVGGLQVTAAWFPFFQPHLYDVVGQDLGVHDLGLQLPQRPDASVEDRLQAQLLTTQRPPDVPFPGDVGLRVTREVAGFKLGGSWSWTTEKLPQVTADPELAAVLADRAAGRTPSSAALLSLQQRFEAGEQLWRGRYEKGHVVSAEASGLLGPAQLDVDVGYSPAQTFLDDRFRPLRKQAVTAVVGLSQAEADSNLLYSVAALGLAVPGVAADELLVVLEPGTARGAARWATAAALVGTVAWKVPSWRLEVGLRAVLEPRGSAVAPKISWQATDRVTLLLGAEFYQGRAWSPFGLLDKNDQVIAGVQVAP